MEFTGERFIPGKGGAQIHYEHLHRYLFAKNLVVNQIVLDLGCGNGYGSVILATRAAKVFGFDISLEAIDFAQTNYKREKTHYLVGDSSELPFRNETFDRIIAFELIEHVEDQRRFLKEVKRVLKKSAQFIVSTPNKKIYLDKTGTKNPYHKREFYLNEIEDLLRENFQHMAIFGQKIIAGSVLWEINSDNLSLGELYPINLEHFISEKGQQFEPHGISDPVYFTAVCWEEDNAKEYFNSVLIDSSKAIISEKEKDETILQQVVEEKEHRYQEDISAMKQVIEEKEALYQKDMEGLKQIIGEKEALYDKDTGALKEVIDEKQRLYEQDMAGLKQVIEEKECLYRQEISMLRNEIEEQAKQIKSLTNQSKIEKTYL